MRYLLLISILLFSSNSYSDEIWLHMGMFSKHLSSKDYNERHRLLGLEYNDWNVGYYNNSYNRDSYFLFKSFDVDSLDEYLPSRAKFKLKIGLISGYENVIYGVMPAVVPVLSFDYEPVSIDINMLGNVYSVQFKFRVR